MSLPSRERGLKSKRFFILIFTIFVAPLAGAWIEITFMGFDPPIFQSLPSRERGLKLFLCSLIVYTKTVAPLAGAWIEI